MYIFIVNIFAELQIHTITIIALYLLCARTDILHTMFVKLLFPYIFHFMILYSIEKSVNIWKGSSIARFSVSKKLKSTAIILCLLSVLLSLHRVTPILFMFLFSKEPSETGKLGEADHIDERLVSGLIHFECYFTWTFHFSKLFTSKKPKLRLFVDKNSYLL